jgi:hypothetical protein
MSSSLSRGSGLSAIVMSWLLGCGNTDPGVAAAGISAGTGGYVFEQGLGGSTTAGREATPIAGTLATTAGAAPQATAGSKNTAGKAGEHAGASGAAGKAGAAGLSAGISEFWISPSGKDTNSGAKEAPMFSVCSDANDKGACRRLCRSGTCRAGTIWVMDGTYKYAETQQITSSYNGSASDVVKVFAEPGATPVFDFSGISADQDARGLQLGGNYWHVKGITVTGAADTGFQIMGSNIIVEQCVAHHNGDAGIVIGTNPETEGSGQDNTVLNCDSYQNNDVATRGENADGFGMKKSSGKGNVFRGCRAWDNADDGFDLYAWASPVTIDNCWVMSQSKSTRGSASDGNGFKLGGDGVSAKHILSKLFAADNAYGTSGAGFTNNNNPASMSCSGCASWGNKSADRGVSGLSGSAPSGATAPQMIAAKRNADGSLPEITSL